MRVVVQDNQSFDLKDSVLHDEPDSAYQDAISLLQGEVLVKGAVVFDSQMKVMPMISQWLTYGVRYNKIGSGTAGTYGRNIGYFIDYLQSHPVFKSCIDDQAFLEIEEHTILEYITYMKDTLGIASTTIRSRDAAIMNFYEEYLCATRGNKPPLREDNPYEDGLISAAAKSQLIEMCSVDELIALLRVTKSERERALVQFMFDSGVRRAEVPKIFKQQFIDAMAFDRQSVIVDEHTVQIPSIYKPFFVDGVKGRRRETKPRHTVVSDIVLHRVKRYHSSPLYRKSSRKFGKNAPAFLNAEGNSYTPSAISKLYERLSKRALKYGYITRAINPHMMRHAFAGSVLRSPDLGSDAIERLMTVQVCLGHSHLSTTQIYTSLPYDIYGILCSDKGEVLTRAEIMSRVYKRTKLTIGFKDRK